MSGWGSLALDCRRDVLFDAAAIRMAVEYGVGGVGCRRCLRATETTIWEYSSSCISRAQAQRHLFQPRARPYAQFKNTTNLHGAPAGCKRRLARNSGSPHAIRHALDFHLPPCTIDLLQEVVCTATTQAAA